MYEATQRNPESPFTMAEVRTLIRKAAQAIISGSVPMNAPVKFIHRYEDNSGEVEIETVYRIDRVEIVVEPNVERKIQP